MYVAAALRQCSGRHTLHLSWAYALCVLFALLLYMWWPQYNVVRYRFALLHIPRLSGTAYYITQLLYGQETLPLCSLYCYTSLNWTMWWLFTTLDVLPLCVCPTVFRIWLCMQIDTLGDSLKCPRLKELSSFGGGGGLGGTILFYYSCRGHLTVLSVPWLKRFSSCAPLPRKAYTSIL